MYHPIYRNWVLPGRWFNRKNTLKVILLRYLGAWWLESSLIHQARTVHHHYGTSSLFTRYMRIHLTWTGLWCLRTKWKIRRWPTLVSRHPPSNHRRGLILRHSNRTSLHGQTKWSRYLDTSEGPTIRGWKCCWRISCTSISSVCKDKRVVLEMAPDHRLGVHLIRIVASKSWMLLSCGMQKVSIPFNTPPFITRSNRFKYCASTWWNTATEDNFPRTLITISWTTNYSSKSGSTLRADVKTVSLRCILPPSSAISSWSSIC